MTEIRLDFADITPYPKQRVLLDSKNNVVCEGGTKTGKTVATMVWQMLQFIEGPADGDLLQSDRWAKKRANGRHAWFAQTYAVAKISYDRAVTRLRPLIIAGLIEAVSTPFPVIRGAGSLAGREWHFLTTDNVSNIYGKEWQTIVVEEFTRHKMGALQAIRTTAKPLRAPTRMIGNLTNKINEGFELARQCEAGIMGPDWEYLLLTCWDARDAGMITTEELEQERKILRDKGKEHLFARDYECVFADANRPFPVDLVHRAVRSRPVQGRSAVLIDAGGKENPAGLVVVYVWQESGITHAHIVHAEHWLGPLDQLERRIGELIAQHQPAAITHDTYAPMLADTLHAKYPQQALKTAEKEINTGYESAHAMMQAGTLTMEPGLDCLTRDLDHVEHVEGTIELDHYDWHFAQTGRLHRVHCDAAAAFLQGWNKAVGKCTGQDGAGEARVHGSKPRTYAERRAHTNTRRDFR